MGFVPAELAERYSENRAMKSLERRILYPSPCAAGYRGHGVIEPRRRSGARRQ